MWPSFGRKYLRQSAELSCARQAMMHSEACLIADMSPASNLGLVTHQMSPSP